MSYSNSFRITNLTVGILLLHAAFILNLKPLVKCEPVSRSSSTETNFRSLYKYLDWVPEGWLYRLVQCRG